jgi:phage tail sheath protein FI
MPSYKRPGVYIEEVLNAATSGGVANSDSLAAFIGVTNRGPLAPTLIANWSDYTRLFGDFSNGTYLPYTLFQYFANGGGPAYVARVASASGTALATRSTSTSRTPRPAGSTWWSSRAAPRPPTSSSASTT